MIVFAVWLWLSTIGTPRACHSFIGLLTSRSFLDVEPREASFGVLAPAAAARKPANHVAHVAYGLPRILGNATFLPFVILLYVLPLYLDEYTLSESQHGSNLSESEISGQATV